MLVLSRKRNEQIVISGSIIVTVVDIRGDKVRLGVEAPLDVSVHRKEVSEAIERMAREEASSHETLPVSPKPQT